MSRIFGSPSQLGYIVRDIRAGMDAWVAQGVGPWFYFENIETDYFRHRGVESPLRMSAAIANSGPLQIELIQQRNDAPSLYREFLDSGREGFQHISYWTTEYELLHSRALARGYVVGHEGSIGGEQGRFAYLESPQTLATGTVIEISDVSGPKGQFFAHVRELAADWDGTEPIRQVS
ncbi:MAG TPA: VOC family protein [Solirubrobacteraceae bacterium]|nr:VOC family protein [Solirubrobacteraceae bacterium]